MITTEEFAGVTSHAERRRVMRQAVRRGMSWLDGRHPGWRGKIDLATLDLGDCGSCVLGQVFGYYRTDGALGDLDTRISLGFTWYNADTDERQAARFRELTAIWCDEIERERQAT